ncbi:MAG: hypothetical protein ACFFAH_01170 [Promethearchaeota archaeon]
MERKEEETLEEYINVDFYENQVSHEKSPYSLIMDLSELEPDELEIEDEIKLGSLWERYSKKVILTKATNFKEM